MKYYISLYAKIKGNKYSLSVLKYAHMFIRNFTRTKMRGWLILPGRRKEIDGLWKIRRVAGSAAMVTAVGCSHGRSAFSRKEVQTP